MVEQITNYPFDETPVQYSETLSKMLGISFFLKRDDLFMEAGGGNKARKLQYILEKAVRDGHNAVVTCGDVNSNHNRATALMAAKLGLKAILVIHDGHPNEMWCSPNLQISRISGAEIVYCLKKDVGQTMDKAMENFRSRGLNPLYIWGGGHSLEGAYAYYDAVSNTSGVIYDYVIVASGTGTTHAGLHVGFKQIIPECKTIGISIARKKEKGVREVFKSVNELESFLNIGTRSQETDIIFYDDYLLGGYGHSSKEENDLIKKIVIKTGLLLDPVYTGKAFFGMRDLIMNGRISKASNVLFWHTGGLNNLLRHCSRTYLSD